MVPDSIAISLPLPPAPLSPNYSVATYGGRLLKAAATKKQRRLAKEAIEACRIEDAPWKSIDVKAYFRFPRRCRRDPDNANGSLKAAYDGIVDAGLVIDDDWEHMIRLPPECTINPDDSGVTLIITRHI